MQGGRACSGAEYRPGKPRGAILEGCAPLPGAGLDEVLDVVDVAAREGDDAVPRAHVQVAARQPLALDAQRREAFVGAHLRVHRVERDLELGAA